MTGIEVRVNGAISKRRMIELLNALTPIASDKIDIEVTFTNTGKIMVINHLPEDTRK